MTDACLDIHNVACLPRRAPGALRRRPASTARGERILAVLGPTGPADDAVLLNGILGRHRQRAGGLHLRDRSPVARRTCRIRRRVGMRLRDPRRPAVPTVREDVAFGPANLGLSPRRVDDGRRALTAVGAHSSPTGPRTTCRSGSAVRVAVVATVIAMRPDVLVSTGQQQPSTRRAVPNWPTCCARWTVHAGHGDPRPALRPRALRALGHPQRRPDRRRFPQDRGCSPTTPCSRPTGSDCRTVSIPTALP